MEKYFYNNISTKKTMFCPMEIFKKVYNLEKFEIALGIFYISMKIF